MDSRLAILFAAVAEERSFTRAAARLNLAQPWLSAQIRKLEEQLGFPVFFRTNGPIELTPEGERLFPGALELAHSAQRLRETSRAIASDVAHAVRVGAHISSAGLPEFARLNDDFSVGHRDNRLQVVSGSTVELVQDVGSGRLDAALVLKPFDERGLETIILSEISPYILMPRSSALAELPNVSPKALAGHRVGVVPRLAHPEFFDSVYEPLLKAGVELKPVPEPDPRAMKHFAKAHQMAVIMVEGNLEQYGKDSEFAARPLANTVLACHALVKRHDLQKRALDRYWRLAVTVAAESQKRNRKGVT